MKITDIIYKKPNKENIMIIQPIGNIDNISPIDRTKSVNKVGSVDKTKELSREEIISSKDLTPEQKMERLGINKMTSQEIAEGLAEKMVNGEA